jgi:hypothetical protein
MDFDVLPWCARNKVNVSRSIGTVSATSEVGVLDDDR